MTTSPANIIISYPYSGTETRRVTIATTRVEENWTKALNLITVPKSDKEKDIDSAENETMVIDLLLKKERRWTIDGYLQTGLGTTSPEESNVTEKRDDLHEIFVSGHTFKLIYEGSTYEVDSDKISVIWEVADEDPITKYSVKFTVVACTKPS